MYRHRTLVNGARGRAERRAQEPPPTLRTLPRSPRPPGFAPSRAAAPGIPGTERSLRSRDRERAPGTIGPGAGVGVGVEGKGIGPGMESRGEGIGPGHCYQSGGLRTPIGQGRPSPPALSPGPGGIGPRDRARPEPAPRDGGRIPGASRPRRARSAPRRPGPPGSLAFLRSITTSPRRASVSKSTAKAFFVWPRADDA